MDEITQRFAEAAEEAKKLIASGYTDVSVKVNDHANVSIILNRVGDPPPPKYYVTLTATKNF